MGVATRRYLAGSVPRSLRASRLSYLPLDAVIGSWSIENPRDLNQTFDVIMLPELDFRRAQYRLAEGQLSTPALQRGTLQVAYSIKDIRVVAVPADISDPYRHALGQLAQLFDLHIGRTVYSDAPSVAASLRTPPSKPLASAARSVAGPLAAARPVLPAGQATFRAGALALYNGDRITQPVGSVKTTRARHRLVFALGSEPVALPDD